ncbi:FRIGIDA-like protein [Caenorhabditis elegans]|uniref:FRIGIDA-like protein n=1 Tax=Caenorhabditis elegans TaxID=6239 RepID=A0A1X7RC32_CAEEL|nr:FRIGIDA-like protein [Caenorhabditis elegans]SMQ11444.1 FRIGIDA-like protein [Caenorhabditis elegans]|eukprot:NP_494743.3 Uncharacterized protein CELE_C16A11.5 [Caenorhabditis elegans]
MEKYGDQVKSIEFIQHPIQRAKHKAVPIEDLKPGSYCILAVDALFELFNEIIWGSRVFEKHKVPKIIEYVLKIPTLLFKSELRFPHFIKTAHLHRLLASFEVSLSSFHFPANPVKEVRNAKADHGFTLQNLKNELTYLGLTETFPDITDYAEIAYNEVMRVKKEMLLRTCDLFDAIEHCQLLCIFNRSPFLKQFLHNQKACHRLVGLHCDLCIKEKVEKSENQEAWDLDESSSTKSPIDCKKCSQTLQTIEDVKKELKTSQNKENKMRKKVSELEKKLDVENVQNEQEVKEMEDDLRGKQEELNILRNDSLKVHDVLMEIADLKQKHSKLEKHVEGLKEENLKQERNYNLTQSNLEANLSSMREGLTILQQYTEELEQERQKYQEMLTARSEETSVQAEPAGGEEEMLDVTKQIEEAKEEKIRLKAEHDANERIIQQLLDKLANFS